jgi:hypothetical protein
MAVVPVWIKFHPSLSSIAVPLFDTRGSEKGRRMRRPYIGIAFSLSTPLVPESIATPCSVLRSQLVISKVRPLVLKLREDHLQLSFQPLRLGIEPG